MSRVECPEKPEAVLGMPLGQYHCPYCGCMQVAGCQHICDPDVCLLDDCTCLPEGVHQSPNKQAWEA